jgi:aminoglycoside phosphotransferase (APT) family kinase protein
MTLTSLHELGPLLGQGRTADIYAWGENQALKLYHPGWPVPMIELEAHISRQLAQTGLPMPAVGDVLTVDGRTGIVFSRVSGPTLVESFMTAPWTVVQSARVFTDLHLAMHSRSAPDLPSQRQYLQRLIDQADVAAQVSQEARQRLDDLPDGYLLCHGDYHPENVLQTRTGPVIIDWATATSGNPLADVARTSLLLQAGELPDSPMPNWLLTAAQVMVHRAYLRRYLRRSRTRLEDVEAWRAPIIVARLGEGIAEERQRMLRLLRQAQSRSRAVI